MFHYLQTVLEIQQKTFQQWKDPMIPGKAASQPFGRKEGSSSSAFSLDLLNSNMDTTLQPYRDSRAWQAFYAYLDIQTSVDFTDKLPPYFQF
jgi:hypothetical protein